MDLPHVWTPWLKANLIAADDVVIVATPDLASLRNAKNIIDLLKHARPNDQAPRLVLNQVDMPGRPEIRFKDFTAALGIEPCCLIPFDAKLFGQASNNGQNGRRDRPHLQGRRRAQPTDRHGHRPRSRTQGQETEIVLLPRQPLQEMSS